MQKMMTEDNIIDMLHMVGTMERRQLIRFFSAEAEDTRIIECLWNLQSRHELKYDPDTACFSSLGAPKYEPFIQKRRLLALDVIAEWGSNVVYSVFPLEFPNLFEICTPDCKTFDFAVIETMMDAVTAARYRAMSIPLGLEDTTRHIAIMMSEEKADQMSFDLINCGFDHACIVDKKTRRVTPINFRGHSSDYV